MVANVFVCMCVCVAVAADEGMLLPNRRWDAVPTNNEWYEDLSTFYKTGNSSYKYVADFSFLALSFVTMCYKNLFSFF